MHVGWRGAAGELRGLPGDEPPALEPVDDPRRVGTGDRAVGEDRSNRGRAGLGERLDGRVHRLRGNRLQHVHGEPRLPATGLLQAIAPLDPRRRHRRRASAPCSTRPSSTITIVSPGRVAGARATGGSRRARSTWRGRRRPGRVRRRIGARQRAWCGTRLPLWWSRGRGASHRANGRRRRLSVVVTGDGDPLLLIPGLGAGRSAFDPIVADLARAHRVITFDPRGIGESEGGANATMTAMALDVVAVLDAAGVASAAVFGASMGGLVAQHLVVDHPGAGRPPHPRGDRAGRRRTASIPSPADQAALLGKGARTPEEAYRLACTVLYSPQFQRTHPEFIEAQIRERARHPVRPRVFSAQFKAMWLPDDSFERLAVSTVADPGHARHRGRGDAVRERAHPCASDSRRACCVRSKDAATCSSTSVPRRPRVWSASTSARADGDCRSDLVGGGRRSSTSGEVSAGDS